MVVAPSNNDADKCIPPPVGGLPVGTRIQDYSIKGVVGEGGFAIVYLADDVLLHREVAIKEYMPAALAVRNPGRGVEPRSASHGETFTKGMRSFINEARLLAQFKHPALIDVLRFWEENGTAYMAMPYYRGSTLRELLRRDGFLCDEAWLRHLIQPILSGLQAMHRENCFHRDISTDNIIVLANGNPVLLDFGAARRIVAAPDQFATIILKPGFAPVEQYSDDIATAPQGPWTDIYALCAVCYLAISGRMPTTSVARIMRDPLIPLVSMDLPGFTANFLAAIDKGLSVRPEDRPQTIKDFVALIDRPSPVKATKQSPSAAPDAVPPAASASPETPTTLVEHRLDSRLTDAKHATGTSGREPETSVRATGVPVIAADSTPRRRSTDRLSETTPDTGPKTVPLDNTAAGKGPKPRHGATLPPRRYRSLFAGAALALGLILLVGYWWSSPSAPLAEGRPADELSSAKPSELPNVPAPVTEKVEAIVPPPAETSAPVRPDPRPEPANSPSDRPAEAVAVPPPNSAETKQPTPTAAPRQHTAVAAGAVQTRVGERATPPRSNTATDGADVVAAAGRATKAEPGASAASKGAVDVRIHPWGMVSVDGRSFGAAPPLRRIWLSVGKHTLVLSHPRAESFTAEIAVTETGVVEVAHDFAAAPAKPR